MVAPKLSSQRLVNVQVTLTPAGAIAQSLNVMLLLATGNVIDVVERYREYTSVTGIGTDFGTTSNVYLAAQAYFSQSPKPRKIMIGKWARATTEGGLRGAPVDAADADYTNWTSITNGGITVTVDGGSPQNVTGLNFAAATSMDAIAAIIDAGITGATCTWDPSYTRFTIRSETNGASSSISFLTPPGSGTSIANKMKAQSSNSGAYQYPGSAAEGATAIVNYFDENFGKKWYALAAAPQTALSDIHQLNLAAAIEALSNKHLFFATTQDAATLVAATTTDLASQLKALGRRRTFIQYSSSTAYAAISACARLINVNYNFANSTITLMYKNEPGVVAENLTEAQVASLEGKNCNVFVAYDNDTNILQRGVQSDGVFSDIVTGTDSLAIDIQNDIYNELYTTPTKVPQTDAGMNRLAARVEARCSQYVLNGFLAPGVWNSDGVGQVVTGDYLPKGFYVYVPRVDSQAQADRAARIAVPIQVLAKTAGAIHTVDISLLVNQ